jgi:hypothetical protein
LSFCRLHFTLCTRADHFILHLLENRP